MDWLLTRRFVFCLLAVLGALCTRTDAAEEPELNPPESPASIDEEEKGSQRTEDAAQSSHLQKANKDEPILDHERINRFPEFAYYPSKPVPGYPGWKKPYHKMPPEYIPYDGSIEHYRHYMMKYLPAVPMWNHRSLVKNWVMKDYCAEAGDKLTTYAEKIYRYEFPNDRGWETRSPQSQTTEFADPVTVLRLKPGDSIKPFTFGPLKAGLYNLRVIAAISLEDDTFPVKEMLFRLTINDRRDGKASVYVLRGRTMCNFYSAVDFFFHVVDKRSFKATLTYLQQSEPDLYVCNVDLHNALAEMQYPGIKQQQSLPPDREVNAVLEEVLKNEAAEGHAFDAVEVQHLWESVPPLNTMIAYQGITYAPSDPKKARHENRVNLKPRMWKYDPRMQEKGFCLWRKRADARLDNVKTPARMAAGDGPDLDAVEGELDLGLEETDGLKTQYGYAELRARKPLPGTQDRGCGQRVRAEGGQVRYNADLAIGAKNAYLDAALTPKEVKSLVKHSRLPKKIFAEVFRFAALVYQLPTLTFSHHLPHQVNLWRNDRQPGHIGYTVLGQSNPGAWCPSYDLLFPYIARSEKLARALHEHIPWIRRPEDVVRLFDTHLIQYTAKLFRYYHVYWGAGQAPAMIQLATIMNNAEASKASLDWLSRNSWIYPQALGGFMDNFTIGTTRDGGTTIGSFFYGHTPRLAFVEMMDRYVRFSGDKEYDLSDWRRYPKARTALLFPMTGRVAGYYPPGIGDVGGPSTTYYQWKGSIPQAARLLYQWTRKPEYAHLIVKHGKRGSETAEEWKQLKAMAAAVRDPLLSARSRVQSDWQVVLESGSEYDDPRAKAAVSIRIGTGSGHAHADTLDMRVWAHGLTMVGDAGMRPAYGRPTHTRTFIHNLVEVNERNHQMHAWATNLADMPGAPYARVQAAYPDPEVKLYARQVMLVKASEGNISPGPAARKDDPAVKTPTHYVVDVFRVQGGRVHTYCFHGSVDDRFEVNVPKRKKPSGPLRQYLDAFYYDQKYYRLLARAYGGGEKSKARPNDLVAEQEEESIELEEKQAKVEPELHEPWVGKCADKDLVATWRLERTVGKRMIQAAAAPTEPRKFTRLTLFEQKDAMILHGLCINDPPRSVTNPSVPYYAVREVYARREAEDLDSVFVALIEPYAGAREVSSARLLAIADNGTDSTRAVALKVKTAGGRTDVCFVDDASQERELEGGLRVQAEAAYVSRDAKGLRQASISGGAFLRARDVEIVPTRSEYSGEITKVDYAQLQAVVDSKLPPKILDGQYWVIGNDLHTTGFTIESVHPKEDMSLFQFNTSIEIFRSRVVMVYGDVVRVATAALLPHGRRRGLTATNESYTKTWRAEMLAGGNRWNGFGVKLSGADISRDDFPPGSGLVVHEFGVGDDVACKTYVSLSRRHANEYKVTANVGFRLKLKAKAAAYRTPDAQDWQPAAGRSDGPWLAIDLSPAALQTRECLLKVE